MIRCFWRRNRFPPQKPEAEELGADAIVNIRYASSAVMQGAAEVTAYGTAVRFRE